MLQKLAQNKFFLLFDYILAILGVVAALYIVLNGQALQARTGIYNDLDCIIAYLGILLVLEASRRISGPALPLLAILFLAYCYFGRYIPLPLFAHRGYSIRRILSSYKISSKG